MDDIERQLRELGRRTDDAIGPLQPTPSDLARIRTRRLAFGGSSIVGAFVIVAAVFSFVALAPDRRRQDVADPSPTATATAGEDLSEKVVMAFGNRGDIWVALSDGSTRNITLSPDREQNPTISYDGEVIVYESGNALVYRRFDTGETDSFAVGSDPTFGALGYLAWTNEGDILVGSPFGGGAIAQPSLGNERWEASNLAWDQSLELLYYDVAQGHGTAPFRMDVIRKKGWECPQCGGGIGLGEVQSVLPDDAQEGEVFVGTTLGSGVDLFKLCCVTGRFQDEPWEKIEIGGLDINDVAIRYGTQRSLDDLELRGDGALVLDHAGELAAEVDGENVRWKVTNSRAWFVVENGDVWLVRYRGEAVQLPYRVEGGIAVNPLFSDSPYIHSFDEF